MAERRDTPRGGRLRRAEKLALGITVLALALTVGYHAGTARRAPELSLRSEVPAQPAAVVRTIPEAAVVDINSATAEELQTLRGIGPALAQRIVEYRREHGPFRRVEDITLVKGIGMTVLEENRTILVAGEGST